MSIPPPPKPPEWQICDLLIAKWTTHLAIKGSPDRWLDIDAWVTRPADVYGVLRQVSSEFWRKETDSGIRLSRRYMLLCCLDKTCSETWPISRFKCWKSLTPWHAAQPTRASTRKQTINCCSRCQTAQREQQRPCPMAGCPSAFRSAWGSWHMGLPWPLSFPPFEKIGKRHGTVRAIAGCVPVLVGC